MTIGEFLKDIRKQKGLTITKVAQDIGFTKQYISMIEKNKCKPTLKLMKILADYYNIKLSYLVELYDKSI